MGQGWALDVDIGGPEVWPTFQPDLLIYGHIYLMISYYLDPYTDLDP